MIVAAYASLAHWLQAGTGVNRQRGEWLIARVHVELARPEPALHHLRRTEALTDAHRDALADFDHAFLEALAARVHALAGDNHRAGVHYAKALAMGEALAAAEDRRVFLDQLVSEPWFGLIKPRAG